MFTGCGTALVTPFARDFTVDEETRRSMVRVLRARAPRVLFTSHWDDSHPDHAARPSQYDLDHAWPTFAYIIVSVMNGAAADMTVWYLKHDRSTFEEGSLEHGQNSHSDAAQAVHGQAGRG